MGVKNARIKPQKKIRGAVVSQIVKGEAEKPKVEEPKKDAKVAESEADTDVEEADQTTE